MLYGALSTLEPFEVKVSRRVLRGESSREAADLPGGPHEVMHRFVGPRREVSNF